MDKTTILLVRHGESEGNVLGVFTGHSGYPLTKLGHKQAELTAEYIAEHYPVSAVYSSDLPRAFQTAEHIAHKFMLPVVTDCRFREINAGKWENKPFSELPMLFSADYAVWKNDIAHARCTDGESVLEVAQRAINALSDVAAKHAGQCIVVVAHATPIGTTVCAVSEVTAENMKGRSWGSNCAINEFEFADGKLRIIREYFAEHLAGLATELPSNV